ncbi:uncharacterized protein [Musca autumnalis]|uniref:uncharacterized protein n=1 Tax=Musca autumnalis TaxID=221902 RepID=UPI003CF758F4
MGCCTVRCWSLFLAWLSLILTIVGFGVGVSYILYLANAKEYERTEEDGLNFVKTLITLVGCLINFIIYILLLVGIYQNRHRLMAVYVYVTIIGIVLSTICVIAMFIIRLSMRKQPVEESIISFVVGLVGVGLEILIFSPIYVLYKRVRRGNVLPEQCALRTNQPLHKPGYN